MHKVILNNIQLCVRSASILLFTVITTAREIDAHYCVESIGRASYRAIMIIEELR